MVRTIHLQNVGSVSIMVLDLVLHRLE